MVAPQVFGQCGNQIGGSFWPLLLKEYENLTNRNILYSLGSFFYNSNDEVPLLDDFKNGNLRARSLLIDMENSVVSSLRNGPYRSLYDEQNIYTSYPGSGNNWGIGFYEHGDTHGKCLETMVQKAAEKCDRLAGFLPVFSLAGGTGSGLGSFMLTLLEEMYPKLSRLVTCVHPGINSDVITMPYNVAFALDTLLDNASCVFPVDNKALLDLCLFHTYERKNCKPYANMNTAICTFLQHLTSAARFPGVINLDMLDFINNMIPFPEMNFLSCSYSPVVVGKASKPCRRVSDGAGKCEVMSKHNMLMRIEPRVGCVLSGSLFGRGEITLTTLRSHAAWMQKHLKFVTWNESVKLSLCSAPPAFHPYAVLCFLNSTATSKLFAETCSNFEKLYSRKAHVHHYEQIVGFPDDKFTSTLEKLRSVMDAYKMATHLPC